MLRRQGKIDVSTADIRKGMKKAVNHGRMEILSKEPYILIDGAHNADGARALKETVLKNFAGKKILMVTGILADKEVEQAAHHFREIASEFIVTEPATPRALKTVEFARIIGKLGGKCTEIPDPKDAVKQAMDGRERYDLIVFAGSLYLIGDIRSDILYYCGKMS